MAHISEFEMERYIHQDLHFLGRIKVKMHLRGCSQCAERLAKMQEDAAQRESMYQAIRQWDQVNGEAEATLRLPPDPQ